MTAGRTIAAAVFALASLVAARVEGSPVTYDFAGTFAQPVFGSNQFTGTITYDTSLPTYPGTSGDASHAYYASGSGTPIAMTLNLGTSGTNPLGTPTNSELAIFHTTGDDSLNLDVTYRNPTTGQYNFATFGMLNDNTTSAGPFTSLNPPASLSLGQFNLGSQLIINASNGSAPMYIGTVTALLSPSTVPEPASAAVFAALAAGLAFRRVRARAGRRVA
jgi:hypothetical protein